MMKIIRIKAWKITTNLCYVLREFLKICCQRKKFLQTAVNICEIFTIGIISMLDIFIEPFKCWECCKCCKCCENCECCGSFDCCGCFKYCQYEEDIDKEYTKSLTFNEIYEGARDMKKFLFIQINICKHLEKDEKKEGESLKLKGLLDDIKKAYKELGDILNINKY